LASKLNITDFYIVDLFLSISLSDLINPEFYINNGGLWMLLFIVFAETGLMFGFFLPGDSLIFIAGIYSSKLIRSLIPGGLGSDFAELALLILLLAGCGILGNMVGYWFGRKSGPYLFNKKDSFIFKQKYLKQAKDFYDQYGAQAIVIARFLPTIRTFAPIIAGVVNMNRGKFLFYNVIGSFLWITSMAVAGHYLDHFFISQFDFNIKERLEIIIIGLFVITSVPFIWKYYKSKRKS